MTDVQSPIEDRETATLVRGTVTGFEQGIAALAGLFTAGPLGALAAWGAIRGVQGKWTPWFILGIPSVIAINAFNFGMIYAFTTIIQKQQTQTAPAAATTQQTKAAESPSNQTTSTVSAQRPSLYDAGVAVGGQSVQVDLGSIRQMSDRGEVRFVYYLGNERVSAVANCGLGTWTTLPEMKTHTPQSDATRKMIDRVCLVTHSPSLPSTAPEGVATVIDPPSNIRSSPNGSIICSVTSRGSIPVKELVGDWYKTDFCGSPGYIHKSQIKF